MNLVDSSGNENTVGTLDLSYFWANPNEIVLNGSLI
jgi:hypothetical protein